MAKINVVEIIGDACLSGAPSHLLNLVKGLSEFPQFNFLVICPPGPFLEKVDLIESVEVEHLPFKGIFDFKTVRKIRKILKQERQKAIDKNEKLIVHAHGTRGGWLGRLATIGLWVPVVYTEHLWTLDYHLKNKLSQYFQISGLWFLDFFTNQNIAVSGAVADFMVRRISRPEKISLIYNGIEINRDISKKTNKDKIIIGSVGGLNYQKNYSFLLTAAKLLKEKGIRNWRIEIIGEGEEEKKLRKLRQELGLNNFVKFLPYQKNLDKKIVQFSIYVQPSRSESFGQAVVMAMNLEVVPVVSNRGALPEIVGKTGMIFDLDKPQNLAEILTQLVPSPQMRKKLGKKARRRVKKYFTIEKMISATKKLYENLVSAV